MDLKKMYQKIAYKKILFTLFVTVIYIVGSNITLPGINAKPMLTLLTKNPNAAFSLQMAGMSLDRMSLFSIGIGPWMSALILWRALTAIKIPKIDNLTKKQSYMAKFFASMFFGAIQAAGLILQGNLNEGSTTRLIMLMIILLSGVAVLIWLGNLNMHYGLGGATIIVMAGMSRGFIQRIRAEISTIKFDDYKTILILIAVIIGVIIFSVFTIFFINGQLRLPVKHIMLNNKYESESYLPISVNPAGGMPFMYAFTIVALPQYAISLLSIYYPDSQILSTVNYYLSQDNLPGIIFLILVVILLSYAFSFVNIDNKEIAENMKKSGDYFPNVYPGKNTEKYLHDKVMRVATVGTLFNVLVMGVPMLVGVVYQPIQEWAFLITMWSMWLILIQQILIQFVSLYGRGSYSEFAEVKIKRSKK
ncbi:accessory Sec system protein translocase subunit SecY2 [Companilactobacillus sp. RD055328]|uniref:accessory Sec system protein translocase subunit SecY2 n=1 Tax=Companilactobacillus sp. RD055328 TaxID=2916634 RepID=UPI001FC8B216|nr:accessory Sec system protein translocase subunit SecY2 [Companilactobacillus sp. RD055328]GKQ42753.1 accessory Sec system protein translocase subunit SecY2 [Companilactobacillus sp. RD055328]